MEIYEKLLRVQSTLKCNKSQYNAFGNYNYRNCEDILEAVKPILADVGAVINLTDDIVQVGDRFYVKATATFIDITSEKSVKSEALAREEEDKKGMDGSQITGSASSYARKYALNGLFAIDDVKDSDTTNTHGKDKTPQNSTKTTTTSENTPNNAPKQVCANCGEEVSTKVAEYSKSNFGKVLCFDCQKQSIKINNTSFGGGDE